MKTFLRVGICLLSLLAVLFGALAPAGFALAMAVGTYTPTTSASGLNKLWRKVQGPISEGIQFMSEEWQLLDDLKEYRVVKSAREILVPLDINEGAGVALIPEGGYEARPSSPNLEELTLTWTIFNKRFTASKTARWLNDGDGEAELRDQLVYQGQKAIQDIGRSFSDHFYGFSTAVLAQTSTAATQASGTYTLKNAYGLSTIAGSTTATAAYIAEKFRVGDWVALIRSAALVTNAIGEVTAVSAATPSITVTWNGSVTSADNDYVVKANSLENTTIAGTDYNKGLVGIFDMMTSTSVHSLSSSSVSRWAVAYSDATGGRFSGARLHRARDEIMNRGGGSGNVLLISQGAYRDLVVQNQAAVRFGDSYRMEIDGEVRAKGTDIIQSRRVPPGYAFIFDKASVRKLLLLPKPTKGPSWDDAEKIKDQSGYVFNIDFPCQLVVLNRQNLAYFSGLTES